MSTTLPERRAALEKRVAEIEVALSALPDSDLPRFQLVTEWEALLSELASLREKLAD